MRTAKLDEPNAAGHPTIRQLTGPGAEWDRCGFHLWICRAAGTEFLPLPVASRIREQVLFVTAGNGRLRWSDHEAELPYQGIHALHDGGAPSIAPADGGSLEVVYFGSPLPLPEHEVLTADLAAQEGIRFPAGRWGRSITNGGSPIRTAGFTSGLSVLAPGGQVPWHNHPDRQMEVYLVLSGRPQMCVGDEVQDLQPPAAVFIAGDQWHQLTNLHTQEALRLIYCYEGSVAAPHWWQERDGILPVAGVYGNPPLPAGAFPQCTVTDPDVWRHRASDLLSRWN